MRWAIAILFLVFFAPLAPADEGCPPNQFPSSLEKKCIAVSRYDRIRADDEPMSFTARQLSMHMVWISAEGIITKDTPRDFEKFLKTHDASITNVIEFHSPGGNLVAALELGRLIRKAGYRTTIGRTISLDGLMNVYTYKQSTCFSACAYAFLGGVARSFAASSTYALHRFGFKGKKTDGDVAQIVTSEIARYLEQMGVDQRVLRLASSADFETGMRPISVSIAKELRIIFDPDQPYPFVVEELAGRPVASIQFFFRNQLYAARVQCSNRSVPELDIWAPTESFPSEMLSLQEAKVVLEGNQEVLHGTVTSGTAPNRVSYMKLLLPRLEPKHFSGRGLFLTDILNPTLPNLPARIDASDMKAFGERVRWADAVLAVSFGIRSNNAERTLPIVLRNCRR